MGRKDIITKEYMEDTEVFADVFNHMIYSGRRKILKRRNQIPQSFFQAFTEKTGCFQL
ncbi:MULTISPECIES: hypothetical protein [unclassified Ruminococcus]|uniref:hypothetical protein n=1 Tax=unclassified Ruminococcus TaxID=2608920 RepID=UPI00319E8C7F